VAAIDPDRVEQSGRCYQALARWPRLGANGPEWVQADIGSRIEFTVGTGVNLSRESVLDRHLTSLGIDLTAKRKKPS
jgi:hypothetical protein